MTPKEHAQACGHVNRTYSKFREQCEESTAAGVKQFVNNHACNEDLGDHGAHVLDRIVKAKNCIFFIKDHDMQLSEEGVLSMC